MSDEELTTFVAKRWSGEWQKKPNRAIPRYAALPEVDGDPTLKVSAEVLAELQADHPRPPIRITSGYLEAGSITVVDLDATRLYAGPTGDEVAGSAADVLERTKRERLERWLAEPRDEDESWRG